MWCQSRNRRPSATSCFQRPTSYAFHQPHPSAHRTSSYPEDSSHLSLRKTFLNCLNDSPPKVFLSFRRQRASILVSHARQTNTLFSDCHLYYAPISSCGMVVDRPHPLRKQGAVRGSHSSSRKDRARDGVFLAFKQRGRRRCRSGCLCEGAGFFKSVPRGVGIRDVAD